MEIPVKSSVASYKMDEETINETHVRVVFVFVKVAGNLLQIVTIERK